MERDDPEALKRAANAAIARAQFAAMRANGSAAPAAIGSGIATSCNLKLLEAEGVSFHPPCYFQKCLHAVRSALTHVLSSSCN